MLPKHFIQAIEKIKNIERHERYHGAFIFGSVARGNVTEKSDLDINVVTNEDNPCESINHPFINRIKLDITFLSQGQLARRTEQESKSGRIPMIAESTVVFDKTGALTDLRKRYMKVEAPKYTAKEHQSQQFMIYHANDKVERNLTQDPDSAMLAMHVGINDLLKIYYRLNGKWWISNKRILDDLDEWDKKLAILLRKFLSPSGVREKFTVWSKIVNYVTVPMGGKKNVAELNCSCKNCKENLRMLLG
ncbi:MAG: nucleotidyltransferase domain-containing protein [bacterium]|nr:nucleotidyltransferase domain-containing protein [bacterium]